MDKNKNIALKNRELTALHTISLLSTLPLSLVEIYKKALNEIAQTIGFGFIAIELFDEEGDTIHFLGVDTSKSPKTYTEEHIPCVGTLSGKVVHSGKHFIALNITASNNSLTHKWIEQGAKTLVSVPIKSTKSIVGALTLGDKREKDVADNVFLWLESMANLLALLTDQRKLGACREESQSQCRSLFKHNENLLKKKEEAEKAIEVRDKFVALVAHDLKSPVISIGGYLKLFKDEGMDAFTADQNDSFDAITEAVDKMKLLINDILNVSRFKTGKITPHPCFINLCALVEKAVEGFKLAADTKGIHLVNNLKDATRIYADEIMFSQVLDNLFSNAIKFSERGATVAISIPEGKKATITVSDNGRGIPQNILKDLFDYSEKTSMEGTIGEIGTGLGLPLSRDIMIAHGGELTAKSEEGKRTIFTATLPDIQPTVLVVDDEDIFRMEQKRYLKQLGTTIVEAGDGQEALDILKERKIHLVVTDVRMPEMDGIELLQHIKSDPGLAHIPVIVVTGFEGMEIRDEAFSNGADDFIPKPFEPEDLVPRVRRFMGYL